MSYSLMNMQVRISISQIEYETAKTIAKNKGMTFQGWLGQLVKAELEKSKEVTNG